MEGANRNEMCCATVCPPVCGCRVDSLREAGPLRHRLLIEAPGYASVRLDLDTLVFAQEYRTGETTLEIDDETIEMIVVEDRVVLKKK